MKRNPHFAAEAAALRQEAEARPREQEAAIPHPSSEAANHRLLHELQVHQVELELQNHALLELREQLERSLAQYTDLYDFAPVGYHQGRVISFQAVGVDITLLKRVEETLREREAMLRNVLETIPVRVFWKDRAGRYLGCNTAFARDAGYNTPEELLNSDDFQMGWREQAELYRTDDCSVMETGIPKLNYEEPQTTPDGGRIWLRTSKIPLRTLAGEIVGILGAYEDITERKRIEESLRQNEERTRLFFERQVVGMAITSSEKRWLQVNDRLCAMLGYSREELGHLTWAELTHPEDLAADITQFEQLLAGDIEEYVLEKRFIREDGQLVYVNLTIACVRRLDGSVDYLLALLEDITERKRVQEALRASEERYSQIAKCVPDLIQIVDLSLRHTYVNPTVERMYGWTVEEYLQLSVRDTVTPRQAIQDAALLEAELALAMAPDYDRNRVVTFESEEVRKDGSIFWAEISATFLWSSDNQPIGVIGIARDITERRQTMTALRESEAFRRRVFESSRIPIVVMDAVTWRFVDCNPAAVEIYRHASREETLGQTPLDVSTPVQYDGTPSPEKARYYIERAQAEGSVTFEWRHQRPTGEVWDAEVHLMAFQAGERGLLQFTLQDITDRKQAETALHETMARLEREIETRREQEVQLLQARKLEAIGRLTGSIAHDFNNLLTVVKGNLELLRGMGENRLDPDQSLLIEDALSAVRQSAELTAGLLAFSRQQPLQPKRTQVTLILQGLERLLERVLGPTITLRMVADPALPDVLSDPGQLQAVLMNLLINAQDAMPDGGALDVRATTFLVCPGAAAPVADLAPGQYVVVTVADSGIGMDADTLAWACEPFFTTKPTGKGTGLGLSTVYGFAAQSRGGLTLESQPGQGTTVRLFLPALEPASGRPAEPLTAPRPVPSSLAHRTETLLVVEDESRVRRLACRYLRELGYTVLEAADAEDALAILETEPEIQLVFSDIVMPGKLNGPDLARWIAAHRPEVKCLLTTGYHDQVQAALAGEALPPILAKPYDKKQLADQIRQQLDNPSP